MSLPGIPGRGRRPRLDLSLQESWRLAELVGVTASIEGGHGEPLCVVAQLDNGHEMRFFPDAAVPQDREVTRP